MKIALLITATALFSAEGAVAQPEWKHVGSLGQRQLVLVEPAAVSNAALLRQAGASTCPAGKPCLVSFWVDAAAVPTAPPMTRAQQQAVIAQYLRNPVTGQEDLLLKCTGSEPAGARCLR